MDERFFPCVAYADVIAEMGTSQKVLERTILDLTEGFREIGLETGHAKTNWSPTHKLQDPWLQAADAQVAWTETLLYVGICKTLNGKFSTNGTTPHEASTKNIQKVEKVLCSPYLAPHALAKAVTKSDVGNTGMLRQEQLTSWNEKTTPQMTRFRGAKVCSKWLQERIDDHSIQSDCKCTVGLTVQK